MSERASLTSQPSTTPVGQREHVVRPGFNQAYAGRLAECDGGRPIPGTRFATREEFCGRLTGEYVDHGDPPWRWYLMTELVQRPDGYPDDAVWCESGNLFVLDD